MTYSPIARVCYGLQINMARARMALRGSSRDVRTVTVERGVRDAL
jgi:hypothetical protein